jgi:predicted CopG family antitoxin
MATKLILLACHHLNLSDEEVRLILQELKAVFRVKATSSPASSMKEQIKQSIGSKMQVSERPRPTPVQLAYAWMERCKEEGKSYGEVLDEYIWEYNMDSTERKLVTRLEADVVEVLPLQTEECQNKIEYHWQNFKPTESAIPLHYLGNKAWTHGSVPRPVSSTLWKEIQRPTPDKRAACVFRWIGVFIANIKNAARLKKKVNLKASAKAVRCDRSPEAAYEMAALFTTLHRSSWSCSRRRPGSKFWTAFVVGPWTTSCARRS